MKEVVYNVSKISCGGCANAITNVLRQNHAVEKVEVDIAKKRVDVSFDESETTEQVLSDKMASIGYPATLVK